MRVPLWRRPLVVAIALVLLTSGAAAALVPPAMGPAGHCSRTSPTSPSEHESGHHHGDAVTAAAVGAAAVTVSAQADGAGCDHCSATSCPISGHCGGSGGVTASREAIAPARVMAGASSAAAERPLSFTPQPPTPPPHARS